MKSPMYPSQTPSSDPAAGDCYPTILNFVLINTANQCVSLSDVEHSLVHFNQVGSYWSFSPTTCCFPSIFFFLEGTYLFGNV